MSVSDLNILFRHATRMVNAPDNTAPISCCRDILKDSDTRFYGPFVFLPCQTSCAWTFSPKLLHQICLSRSSQILCLYYQFVVRSVVSLDTIFPLRSGPFRYTADITITLCGRRATFSNEPLSFDHSTVVQRFRGNPHKSSPEVNHPEFGDTHHSCFCFPLRFCCTTAPLATISCDVFFGHFRAVKCLISCWRAPI